MRYREFNLRANTPDAAATEIMYEIAAARVDKIELIRINISYDADGDVSTEFKRTLSVIFKLMKSMKQKGSIQFFATEESFLKSTTEAVFLLNKYPELIFAQPEKNDGMFIYVKI